MPSFEKKLASCIVTKIGFTNQVLLFSLRTHKNSVCMKHEHIGFMVSYYLHEFIHWEIENEINFSFFHATYCCPSRMVENED